MATVSIPAYTNAVLLDIEGTTTPITFVKVSFTDLNCLCIDLNDVIALLASLPVYASRSLSAVLSD